MEGSIIVEGFNICFREFNVKFTRVISDEDSSVFHKIKEEVIYATQIEKLHCANHQRKNYKKSLLKVIFKYYIKILIFN